MVFRALPPPITAIAQDLLARAAVQLYHGHCIFLYWLANLMTKGDFQADCRFFADCLVGNVKAV